MGILLFNWVGYRLLLNHLQQKADHQLETRIDRHHYDETQLVELRVALNMPYQTAWTEFERHYGEIEIDGKHYTYVKRKIENGYLVLKCIANPEKDRLETILEDSNSSQENSTSPSPLVKLTKSLSTDFDNDRYCVQLKTTIVQDHKYMIPAATFTQSGFTTICEQPPDQVFYS